MLETNTSCLGRGWNRFEGSWFIEQTYAMVSSYLIGLHMTIDFWRPNRDQERWWFSVAFVQGLKESGEWPKDYDITQGPVFVEAVP